MLPKLYFLLMSHCHVRHFSDEGGMVYFHQNVPSYHWYAIISWNLVVLTASQFGRYRPDWTGTNLMLSCSVDCSTQCSEW